MENVFDPLLKRLKNILLMEDYIVETSIDYCQVFRMINLI